MNAFIIVDNLRQLERPKEAFRALVAVSHERMMQDDRFGSQERSPGEFHCILSALQGELARALMDGSEQHAAKAFTQISATAALGLESIIAKGDSE